MILSPSGLQESVDSAPNWKGLLERIVAHSERPSDVVALFRGNSNARVVFHKGTPEKLVTELPFGDAGTEKVTVFFDEYGNADTIRSVRFLSRTFDNGIRRGPNRRSLRSELHLRQDFDGSGIPIPSADAELPEDAELYVHTQSFVGGSVSEVANSFLFYAFDQNGRLVPRSGKISDLTHFQGTERVRILETLIDEIPTDGALSDSFSNARSAVPSDSLDDGAAEWRLPYVVGIYPEKLEVLMADHLVGEFDVRKKFDFAKFEEAFFPGGENPEAVIEAVALRVAESVTR